MHNYTTIVGVISLRLNKISYDTIQNRYGIGRSGIALIMTRFKNSGLSIDDLKEMPPGKVVDLIYPPENLRHKDIPLPDFTSIHTRMLQMGKKADLSYIWLDYKKENPNGYQLSQFYKLYGDYLRDTYGLSKASMPVERIPGEKLYIDWIGDQPELLLDTSTGELLKVHIFTTTMGFSSLIYVEIFMDEKLPQFIAGVVNALSFYGAVPKYLVPDNLKTAVSKHSKDELILQTAFSDLETFYDTIVLPPPPRKPKGKSTVENHVRYLETHLVEKLKEDTYTSLEALNAAAKKIVADINRRPFQKKSDIRENRINGFEKYDKPRMNKLPGENYTLCDYKAFPSVPDNYHLEYDAHYYSVLYTYLGKPAILKATMTEIRICDEYNRLICKHPRSYKDFPLYITEDSHMPQEHRFYKEVNARNGAYYRRWASVYGECMSTLIDRVLRGPKHEEQAYKSCAGILHACKDVPHRIVQEAAEKCVEANACKYSYFKKALGTLKKDQATGFESSAGKLPTHSNIRGREAYK